MSNFGVFVLERRFVREFWCFRCNGGLVVPEPPRGDALYETREFSPDAVTQEVERVDATEPLPPREDAVYFEQFRGDE